MVRDERSLSSYEGSRGSAPAPLNSYHEKFEELFPYYLSIGMTYDQYWNEDSTLVVFYRRAEEIRRDNMNTQLWLQGAYFYEALTRVSPILHAFAKRGTKPVPYLEQPLSITEEQERRKQEEKQRKVYEKGLTRMAGFIAKHNKQFERGSENT